MFLFRRMAKEDPIMTKVWLRQRKHQKIYPAKSCPYTKVRSMAYQDHNSARTKGFPELLQYAYCIDDGILLLKNGSFLSGWRFFAPDSESSTSEELLNLSNKISDSILSLGDGWLLQVDTVRAATDSYPHRGASFFPDKVTGAIEEERREAFEVEGRHYTTENILYLTYKPDVTMEKLVELGSDDEGERKPVQEKALQRFQKKLEEIENNLAAYMRLERLGDYEEEDEHGQLNVYSSLLSYIYFAVSGIKQPVRLNDELLALDTLLGNQDVRTGTTPKIGDKHVVVLAIDGYPQVAWPSILEGLNSLPIPFRFHSRLICLDQQTALKEVDRYRKSWNQKIISFFDRFTRKENPRVNEDAIAMARDAQAALTITQGGEAAMGHYSAGVVLMHEDIDLLEEAVSTLTMAIRKPGFGARVESLNAFEAWLGTHPGNGYSNLRQCLLNTQNYVDLLPLSTIWPGERFNPCPFYPPESPPLFHADAQGATPFRFNLHVGDTAHTLIFGPTGSGKSTLLGFIAAQFRRYRSGNIFAFDKGMSMFPLCDAAGGTHYDIAGENSSLAFCPLQHVNSGAEQSWAEEWIGFLATMQGVILQPAHRVAIHDAMTQIRNAPPDLRSLTNFYHYLQDMEIKDAIKHYTVAGAMGHLLDADEDALGLTDFTVFEIEELMNLGDANLIPVLLYIFHRIERSLNGQPSLLILDEAWVMLGHPVFREKIREWFKVLRKANCAVVLATQSLSDAKKSGILDVLSESCPTKIFLPNLTANQEEQRDLYAGLGLNEKQRSLIAGATPKREYYAVSPEGRRKFNLLLGPVALAFVGASDKDSIGRIKELRTLHGQSWPGKWLEERGI